MQPPGQQGFAFIVGVETSKHLIAIDGAKNVPLDRKVALLENFFYDDEITIGTQADVVPSFGIHLLNAAETLAVSALTDNRVERIDPGEPCVAQSPLEAGLRSVFNFCLIKLKE